MKPFLFILSLLCFNQIQAQMMPYNIEDKRTDAYLMQRKAAELNIHIINLPDGVKKNKIEYTLVQLGAAFQADYFTETNKDGIAHISFDQNLPYQQVWLSVGNLLYTGLYVNSGLTVTIDYRKLPKDGVFLMGEGITYSGKDGALNTVMSRNSLYRKEDKEALNTILSDLSRSRRQYSQDIFMDKLDSIKKELVKIDNEFIRGYKDYARAIQNETLSEFYGQICIAYWDDKMPGSLFDLIKNHQPIFTSNNGVLFYKYLSIYTQSMGIVHGLDQNLRVIDSLYAPQKSDVLKLMLLKTNKDVFAKSYGKIISSIQSKWCKKIASDEFIRANANQKKIDKLFATSTKIEKATIGTPIFKLSFDAELYKVDELKSTDEFIMNLKQKFLNKALIIDFWATWCAPCLSDLPKSKALHNNNKDLPIEYIYLCTSSGSSLELWKTKVADFQIPGTHIFMNEKNIAELRSLLNATGGYPACVAIEANGKINSRVITRMDGLNRESLKMSTGL